MSERNGLGKRQREALTFIEQVNGWHGYASDVAAVILSLRERGLVDVSLPTKQFRLHVPMTCNQCEMLSINGVACHETGCPNSRKTWVADRGEWVLFVECRECGCEVEEGTSCDCMEPIASLETIPCQHVPHNADVMQTVCERCGAEMDMR